MMVQVAMDRTTDLFHCLRQEPEELEWATAGSKRDKTYENRYPTGTCKEAQKPLALLERYCTEGKILHGHIDDRQGLPELTTLLMLSVSLVKQFIKDMHALLHSSALRKDNCLTIVHSSVAEVTTKHVLIAEPCWIMYMAAQLVLHMP